MRCEGFRLSKPANLPVSEADAKAWALIDEAKQKGAKHLFTSPYDLQALVKREGLVRCDDGDALYERLGNDPPVERIRVMRR